MRRIAREALDEATAADLAARQTVADELRTAGKLDVATYWKSARAAVGFRPVSAALRRMAGDTERCMYCLDSHGADVEHFWPKGRYPERMLVWSNLLLACTPCGRFKGQQFPLDGAGRPLMVDPTVDDPWEHLEFDADTGNFTARYDASGTPSSKGMATVSLLQFDRREALQRMYRRSFGRLCDAVESALAGDARDPDSLVMRLRELDDHGLLGWCFSDRGVSHGTFNRLRAERPAFWAACSLVFAR